MNKSQTTDWPLLLIKAVAIGAALGGSALFGEPTAPETLWHVGRCFAGYHAECSDKTLKREIANDAGAN